LAEETEKSAEKAKSKTKNWKNIAIAIGAFILFKGIGVIKFLFIAGLKIIGIGRLFSFHNFDVFSLFAWELCFVSLFLLAIIPVTRFYERLLIIHLRLNKFYVILLFAGWISVCFHFAFETPLFDNQEFFMMILLLIVPFVLAILLTTGQLFLLKFYGKFWRIIATKKANQLAR